MINEDVKKDIIDILKESILVIKKKDIVKLKAISNHTLHDASIHQDNYSTSIAVIIYALYKVYQRHVDNPSVKFANFDKKIIVLLSSALEHISIDKLKSYNNVLKKIYKEIGLIEKKFGRFITEVFSQAKIKKSSRVFEHGVSMGRAAELLGVSQWELAEYVGHAGVKDDSTKGGISVVKRLELARRIFS